MLIKWKVLARILLRFQIPLMKWLCLVAEEMRSLLIIFNLKGLSVTDTPLVTDKYSDGLGIHHTRDGRNIPIKETLENQDSVRSAQK